MAKPTNLEEHQRHSENSTITIVEDLMTRMMQVLIHNHAQTPNYDSSIAQINIKLDIINYALWS